MTVPHFLTSSNYNQDFKTGSLSADTYNVSIGQGDLLVTPLELLNFISSIANGGKIYQPHLISETQPKVLLDYSEWANEIKKLRLGMEDAVSKWYGTASLLSSLPIVAAAKTGTAQIQNNTKTNAFFVGYLPTEALANAGAPLDKQIAILVLVIKHSQRHVLTSAWVSGETVTVCPVS